MDWVWSLEHDRDASLIRYSLGSITNKLVNEVVEAPDASCAIAAAAVVAKAAGATPDDMPDEVDAWLAGQSEVVGALHMALARQAVARIRESSELHDLWLDVDRSDWCALVDELLADLGGPPEPSRRPRRARFDRRRSSQWQPEDVISFLNQGSEKTWDTLRRSGVRDGDEVRIDFYYERGDDAQLLDFMQHETGYLAQTSRGKHGVTGSTQPLTINPYLLEAWIRTMVYAGHDHGRCKLDGWGLSPPTPTPNSV